MVAGMRWTALRLLIGSTLLAAGCGSQEAAAPAPVVTEHALAGIWKLEGADVLWQFGPGHDFALDADGNLASRPGDPGTFRLRGSTLHLRFDGGGDCPADWEQRSRITLLGVARFRERVIEAECVPETVGTTPTWVRVSPGNRLRFDSPDAGIRLPVHPDPSNLRGVWLIRDSSQLLGFTGTGRYARDARGRLGDAPADRGAVRVRGRTVVLRSHGTSGGCERGDVLELRRVGFYQSSSLLRGLTAHVARDTCALLARSGDVVMALIST